MRFISTKGSAPDVDFETAILDGYAPDGGLYVPTEIPKITKEQLYEWKDLDYVSLAFEILSLFIDQSIISEDELKSILTEAYSTFEKEEVIPIHKLDSQKDTYIMELFYGPTISFKDVGMAFLVNLVNFFLKRKKKFLSIIVATTGDTGPAAANYISRVSNMDAWVLYPKGMITEEQERQMTTLSELNVHAVGVTNCPDGGDDLDAVIPKLYANQSFKSKLNLSSVNSINWGRIMMQTVHYFYGYFRIVDSIDEQINVSVPSGGFGNLCAGGLARIMGLPVKSFIVANNKNDCLNRIFSDGIFSKEEIYETHSSAIDILYPINFWRYLYFVGVNPDKISESMDQYEKLGKVQFDSQTYNAYSKGFYSHRVSDSETLKMIKEVYMADNYVLDPHCAVALSAAINFKSKLGSEKLLCLATAHPAKFPKTIKNALEVDDLTKKALHYSIEEAKTKKERGYTIDCQNLETSLLTVMENKWDSTKSNRA